MIVFQVFIVGDFNFFVQWLEWLVTSFKDRIDDDFHVVCYVGFRILKLEHNFGTAVTEDFVRYASNLIKSCSKIVVVAGAGLSTASGIPDFRYSGAFC